MKQGGQGLQDYYLNQLRKEKILATVFLTNGFQLRGRVVSFDNFYRTTRCRRKTTACI